LYLDADTILTRPLDDVFTDPAVVAKSVRTDALSEDEIPLPSIQSSGTNFH